MRGVLTVSQVSSGRKNRLSFEIDCAEVALAFNQEEPETLAITEADPVVKGQTAASSYKPAMLENGIRVLVPKGTKVDNVKDLEGLPVGLSKGTTSEKLFTQLSANEVKMQLTIRSGSSPLRSISSRISSNRDILPHFTAFSKI